MNYRGILTKAFIFISVAGLLVGEAVISIAVYAQQGAETPNNAGIAIRAESRLVLSDRTPLVTQGLHSVIPGNPVIPMGVPLPVDHLQPGSYVVELRASDSAGHSSVARKAEFTVE